MCQGLNYHYFHIMGDGHQPNSRGLYTHYKDSYERWDDHPQYSDFWPWHTCGLCEKKQTSTLIGDFLSGAETKMLWWQSLLPQGILIHFTLWIFGQFFLSSWGFDEINSSHNILGNPSETWKIGMFGDFEHLEDWKIGMFWLFFCCMIADIANRKSFAISVLFSCYPCEFHRETGPGCINEWGGVGTVGMVTLLALVHMVDALCTHLDFKHICTHLDVV